MRLSTPLLLLAVAPSYAILAANQERSLPIFFIPNPNQANSSIRFLAQTPELHAGFAADSAVYEIQGTRLRVRFSGANPDASVEGVEAMTAHANFLIGDDPGGWRTEVPTYAGIVYRKLYPGIDMHYAGSDRKLKSEFLVSPGADPARILLNYSGADRLSVDASGDLVIRAGDAELREQAPIAYQESGNVRRPVHVRYRIHDDFNVGFSLDQYDPSLPLVIDPVISYSTYFGGSAQSAVMAVTTDTAGNLYAAGWTEAVDFPLLGAIQTTNQGGVDAFMFKLNAAGNLLLAATYIGGRGDDRAAAIAVDSSGQIYLAGSTASSNFPLASPIRASLGGTRDAFAVKLNSSGNALIYSTYLGGSGYDAATAIKVNTTGNAFIAGDTQSSDFPLSGPVQTVLGGKTDAFVTRLSPAGAITFSTYLGGLNDEHVGGLAIDASGSVYIAGGTFSLNFPVAAPIQATIGGNQDAFVSKISISPTALVYSTYLGGSGGQIGSPEQANAIAVDATGAAYVTGVTNSLNFPITSAAFQTSFNGTLDAFVTKLNANGSTKLYSTYLGSPSFDWASAIAVDAAGNAYVAGYTSSESFPVVNQVISGFDGLYDAFVSELNPTGNGLTFSTLFGGTGAEQVNAIAVDSVGNMFIGGQTSSFDLPLQGALQPTNLGGATAFVARLGVTQPLPQVPSADSVSPASGSGSSAIFTAHYSHTAGVGALTSVALLLNVTASTSLACHVTYNLALNQFSLTNDSGSGGSVVIPGAGNANNSRCTLFGTGSSATLAGNDLTLTVSLSFNSSFAGTKTTYLLAADGVTNTGFVAKGSWTVTVPAAVPSADSVSPNASTGGSQTFTFTYSDTQDAANLKVMAMLFSATGSLANACYIVYDRVAGTVKLLNDDAQGAGLKPLGSTTVLQNSQCAVGVVSAFPSGQSQVVVPSITFKGAFAGLKNIYMFASEDVVNTGWVLRGTYFVAAGGLPLATSVVPFLGAGPSQRFSFTVTDLGGSSYILGAAMLFSPTLDTNNACSLVFDRVRNTISLAYDNPANGAAPLTPGTATTVSNHQCTLNGINTTVAAGATTLVITLDIAFNATFFGDKNVYLYASEESSNSGWVNVGSWTVTGGSPTADTVNPPSGSALAANFVFTVSDSATQTNIIGMTMLFTTGSPIANFANACYLYYNRANGTIGLYANDGITLNTKTIGSSANLENSQCAVGYTVMITSANSVLFTVDLVFKTPAFRGLKTVYLQALEPNSSSGWVSRGTWAVP